MSLSVSGMFEESLKEGTVQVHVDMFGNKSGYEKSLLASKYLMKVFIPSWRGPVIQLLEVTFRGWYGF